MKKHYSLDPDNPQDAEKVESALLEGMASLQPSTQQRAKIRAQLFQRIHASTAAESARITVRSDQGQWRKIRSGVRAKMLDKHSQSALIRIAADACWTTPQPLPAHDEECLLLAGDAFFGDTLLHSGDWQLAPVGSESRPISTGKGALVFMRGALDNRQSL